MDWTKIEVFTKENVRHSVSRLAIPVRRASDPVGAPRTGARSVTGWIERDAINQEGEELVRPVIRGTTPFLQDCWCKLKG